MYGIFLLILEKTSTFRQKDLKPRIYCGDSSLPTTLLCFAAV